MKCLTRLQIILLREPEIDEYRDTMFIQEDVGRSAHPKKFALVNNICNKHGDGILDVVMDDAASV